MRRALEGRTAIVTGASQGLGRAIAAAYLAAGANVVLCARDAALLAAAARELREAAGDGARVVSLAADVTCEADVEQVVRAALDGFGGLEVLVNNAGVYGPIGRSDEVPWQAWVDALSVNLLGSVRWRSELSKSSRPAASAPAERTCSSSRVFRAPGAIELTSTPNSRSSIARVSAKRTTAALEAA